MSPCNLKKNKSSKHRRHTQYGKAVATIHMLWHPCLRLMNSNCLVVDYHDITFEFIRHVLASFPQNKKMRSWLWNTMLPEYGASLKNLFTNMVCKGAIDLAVEHGARWTTYEIERIRDVFQLPAKAEIIIRKQGVL